MSLSQLLKIKQKKKKRLGRGESSGKGKTAAKGAKGQKKRGKIPATFEGGQLPLERRLPQRRGIGNTPIIKAVTITTSQLNKISQKEVNESSLRQAGLLPKSGRNFKIKLVAGGKIEKALKVELPATKKAAALIKKAGGTFTAESKPEHKDKQS